MTFRPAKLKILNIKILTEDLTQTPSLAECARAANCSAAYLSRTFSEYTGMTMSRYLRNLRLEKAAEFLRTGNYSKIT